MALFKSIPAVSTQKDTTGPIKKKPSGEYKKENLKAMQPISDEEANKKLEKIVKPLTDEADPVVEDDFYMPEDEVKVEPKVEEKPKEEVKETSENKKEVKPKEEKKEVEKPKAKEIKEEQAKPIVQEKEEVKEEPILEEKAPVEEKVEEKPLTLEERRILNLKKAREARLQQQEKEKDNMAEQKTTTTAVKKPAPKPKKAVDMSKMVMTTKKPATQASSKTVYHVSKRGETREDRVWKVFIQESNKVIKLFDYQEEALEYAKQLAKNKNDGSYVILHGLNGKIRKF